jgi:hypothetical protein
MVRTTLRALIVAGACLVASQLDLGSPRRAEAAQPDLFYNFYVGPSVYGGAPAQLYVSPRPTPPLVGWTYVTYQPLMPHEFMYHHHRKYYRYYPSGGHTTTKVCWH